MAILSNLFPITFFDLITGLIALGIGMTVHQYAHSIVAARAGDPTPQKEMMLTLNPLHHAHWTGALTFLLADFGILGRAPIWPLPKRDRTALSAPIAAVPATTVPDGNPTSIASGDDASADRLPGTATMTAEQPQGGGYLRTQDFYAALLAGPLANLTLAAIVAIITNPLELAPSDALLTPFVTQLIRLNILLFVINLLPIYPLDGWFVALALLPAKTAEQLRQYEREACYVLAALIAWHFAINRGFIDVPAQFDVLDMLVGSPTRRIFFRL